MKLQSIALSVLLISSLYAQEQLAMNSIDDFKIYTLEELMDMTVTEIATGTPLKAKYTPGSITIITAQQIKKNGARTFQEALEQVPGLHIYPAKSFAMRKGISIRGIQTTTNPHVLVMIDGVSLGTSYYGSPVFPNKMPTSIIERIEIIRGPGSALYGADAFSGVINIVSKKYENITNNAGMRYGSFSTVEGFTQVKTELDELEIGFSASLVDTDGDNGRVIKEDGLSATPNSLAPGPLNTQYNTLYLHADLHYKELDLNMMLSNTNNSGTHSGASQSLDPKGSVENETYLIDLKHTNTSWFKDTTIKSNISFTSYDIAADYNIVPDAVNVKPGFREDNYFFNTRLIYEGFDKHTLSFGLGYRYSSIKDITFIVNSTDLTGTPATFIPEVSRSSYYGLMQDEYKINDVLNLVAGLRYDDYKDFGGTTNPRLALIWQQSEKVTIKTMYGKAFRAPSFNELYLRNNTITLGNPDLNPETIDTYEISVDYRAPLYTKLNLFYYEAKNLINYVDDGTGTNQAQNQAGIDGYGLELDMSYTINKQINLSGNYAFVDAKYADTKRKVEDIASHQIFAQVEYKPAHDWNINTQVFYFSKRYRVQTDTREPLDADTIVNLTISKDNLFQNLDAVLAVRNLFDTDYREPSDGRIAQDYPMEGINVFAELTYRF